MITSAAMHRLPLPVQQIADWDKPGEEYFQVEENGQTVKHKPVLEEAPAQPKGILREDVALFSAARSAPSTGGEDCLRSAAACTARGHRHGVVRALTDARLPRDWEVSQPPEGPGLFRNSDTHPHSDRSTGRRRE